MEISEKRGRRREHVGADSRVETEERVRMASFFAAK